MEKQEWTQEDGKGMETEDDRQEVEEDKRDDREEEKEKEVDNNAVNIIAKIMFSYDE